jgi:hypothetical protein
MLKKPSSHTRDVSGAGKFRVVARQQSSSSPIALLQPKRAKSKPKILQPLPLPHFVSHA